MSDSSRRALALDMRKRGVPYLEITAATSIPKTSLYRLFSEAKLTTAKDTRRRLSPDEWRYAETLLDDGASYREIARTLKVDAATILRRFPGRGWKPGEGTTFANNLVRLSLDNLLPNRGGSQYDRVPNPSPFVERLTLRERRALTTSPRVWEDSHAHPATPTH